MPARNPWEKGMARKAFERREAKRQENQGSGSTQQSGAGHGTMSRDERRDLTSTGTSLASRHGVGKPSGKKDSGLAWDERMERRDFKGELDMVNTSFGGGPQNPIITRTHDNKVWTKTNQPTDGNQFVATAQAVLNTSSLILTAEAHRPDRAAEAKRRKVKAEAVSSLGLPRQSRAMTAQGDLGSRVTRVAQTPNPLCAECGSTAHTLKDCITTITGSIHACLFCNNRSHVTDRCREFLRLTLADKVKVLVTDRAGMPPILTDSGWWVWLHRFLTSPHTKGQAIPSVFPWRVNFARSVYDGNQRKSLQEYQNDLDFSHDVSALPVDEHMQSMDDVFTCFWGREGRIWPARLDDLPTSSKFAEEAESSHPDDSQQSRPAAPERDIVFEGDGMHD
ncbi:hypothetical protein AU210_010159 [Fusarium oxysporum f. sp. radicis-cucumerinum]|uniref:CCHC-type domain-containing protein n=1 Tax=Fusarium oxysporum f. sp. radicis-cucumerinum TaxID=327505 RepID=A0A2H3GRI5_FUSOX|nr:hypothetical protein AU210_010159 [Fusarium oxysporum f. sp. radicis-cucumerinum]